MLVLEVDEGRVGVALDEALDEPDDVDELEEPEGLDTLEDEPDVVDDGEPAEVLIGHFGVALRPGGCAGGMIAPGSTRSLTVTEGTALLVAEALPGGGAAVDTAVGRASSVLVGPAAPEPKSALRCTKPICATTREMAGTPPTAAATPEMDRAATVTAATTPTRAGPRRERA
ncbi:hypothetical protein [Flexivirga sp.]|uniref:hypothetical protein n=1 Tax=Flexivirga sp. TaxID=1962927 RepID=UPI003F817451